MGLFCNPKDAPRMQLGIVREAAAQRALAISPDVVMDRCVKLEHARFRGGQNPIGLNTGVIGAKRLRTR